MSERSLRIGLVCPYGWDIPGGVQIHVRELAEHFIAQGHFVSVIAPVADDDLITDSWLVNAGRPVPIPFNGSVARVLFGPIASSRVRQCDGRYFSCVNSKDARHCFCQSFDRTND